jgi:hypothetical protein
MIAATTQLTRFWSWVRTAVFIPPTRHRTVFETHGFLSDEIDTFRTVVRTKNPYRQWFEFAGELNLYGSEAIRAHRFNERDTQRMTISALFIRSHQSLQVAMILIERGMIADARTVLRTLVEGAIAQIALAADAGVIDQLAAGLAVRTQPGPAGRRAGPTICAAGIEHQRFSAFRRLFSAARARRSDGDQAACQRACRGRPHAGGERRL